MNNLFNTLTIKPFFEFNLFGIAAAIVVIFGVLYFLYNSFSYFYRAFFIRYLLSETKVVLAKVITLSYRSNFKKNINSSNLNQDKSPEEFNVVVRSDKFKRLVIFNEALFDSIEDGDSFTLEYKEKFEYILFYPKNKYFIKLVPIRATLKNGETFILSRS